MCRLYVYTIIVAAARRDLADPISVVRDTVQKGRRLLETPAATPGY